MRFYCPKKEFQSLFLYTRHNSSVLSLFCNTLLSQIQIIESFYAAFLACQFTSLSQRRLQGEPSWQCVNDAGIEGVAGAKRVPGLPIRVDHSSFGPALQAGFDVNLKDGWLINADVKKVWIDTDVHLNAGAGYVKIDSLDINPWVFGLGVGKKF